MQQRSTEQRSTVDSRRRLTNFTMLVTRCQMLNRHQSVFKNMSTGCRGCCQNQLHFWILNFHSVATYCRCVRNLCGMYIVNFPTNQLVKEFWKSVHICQSYQTSRGKLFETQCTSCTVMRDDAVRKCINYAQKVTSNELRLLPIQNN